MINLSFADQQIQTEFLANALHALASSLAAQQSLLPSQRSREIVLRHQLLHRYQRWLLIARSSFA
jgi:hypothetical protein